MEKPRSRSWEGSKFKAIKYIPLPINLHPFCSMSIGPIPVIRLFQHLTLKIQIQGHEPMMLHIYILGHFHKLPKKCTSIQQFPSYVICKIRTPLMPDLVPEVFAQGQAHMGQMGKWPWCCTDSGIDNSRELCTARENASSGFRDMPQSLAVGRSATCWTSKTVGWEVKYVLRKKNNIKHPGFHTHWYTIHVSLYMCIANLQDIHVGPKLTLSVTRWHRWLSARLQ